MNICKQSDKPMMKFKLDKTQIDLIQTNLNEDGKLTCLNAFKVARLIGKKPSEMAEITKYMKIIITSCELGVFGNLKFNDSDFSLYKNMSSKLGTNKRIECKEAWKYAQKSTLKNVGSTIKKTDLEVTYCQLGCFKAREGHATKSAKYDYR